MFCFAAYITLAQQQLGASVLARRAVRDLEALTAGLPISEVIHNVVDALDSSSGLVLQAPPGAGKTTTVPLALLLHQPDYLKPSSRIVVSRHTSARLSWQSET
eukprot:gene6445-6674_t